MDRRFPVTTAAFVVLVALAGWVVHARPGAVIDGPAGRRHRERPRYGSH